RVQTAPNLQLRTSLRKVDPAVASLRKVEGTIDPFDVKGGTVRGGQIRLSGTTTMINAIAQVLTTVNAPYGTDLSAHEFAAMIANPKSADEFSAPVFGLLFRR